MKPISSFCATITTIATMTACGAAGNDGFQDPDELAASEAESEEGLDDVGQVTQAAASATRVFAWASNPTADHVPEAAFSFNSRGGAMFVDRTAMGQYQVSFGGVFTTTGTPHVVAYGLDANRCQIVGLGTDVRGLLFAVACRTPSGAFADSRFVVSYDESLTLAPTDAAFAANVLPDRSGPTPPATTFNPAAPGSAFVTHHSRGLYTMSFPRLNREAGTVAVTAMGDAPRTCQVVSYGILDGATAVNVACFTPTGALGDSMFTLKYEGKGAARFLPWDTAFAWSDDTVTPSYLPRSTFNFNSILGSSTANRATNELAIQTVSFPAFPASSPTHRSSAMVTGYGLQNAPVYCKPLEWNPVGAGNTLQVRCFTPTGALVKSRHLALFIHQAT